MALLLRLIDNHRSTGQLIANNLASLPHAPSGAIAYSSLLRVGRQFHRSSITDRSSKCKGCLYLLIIDNIFKNKFQYNRVNAYYFSDRLSEAHSLQLA